MENQNLYWQTLKFVKLAAGDIFLISFVPKEAVKHIRQVGLLSLQELIKDKKALKLSKPGQEKKFVKEVLQRLEDPEWSLFQRGVSAFFTLPDFSAISDKHFVIKNKLVPVKINISSLLKDKPKTEVHGVEMVPFDASKKSQPKRERILDLNEIRKMIMKKPSDLWSHYKNPKDKMYAPDVPHAIIVTETGIIPPKYIVS